MQNVTVPKVFWWQPCNQKDPSKRESAPVGKALFIEYEYVNNTQHDVWVLFRDGSHVQLVSQKCSLTGTPDAYPGFKEGFYINKIYRLRGGAMSAHGALISQDHSEPCAELTTLRSQMDFDQTSVGSRQYSHHPAYNTNDKWNQNYLLEYYVNVDDLRRIGREGAYFRNHDVVITLSDPNHSGVVHPCTLKGANDYVLSQYNEYFDPSLITNMAIMLIDNEQNLSSMFTYVAGTIMEIKPFIDKSRSSGLYILSSPSKTGVEPEYWPLHELDKSPFEFFKSRQEAEVGGDIKTKREEELMRMKYEQEMELTSKKKELADLEHELQYIKQANEKLKAQFNAREEVKQREYRERNERRKDSKEELKWMVAMGIALFTAVAAVAKLYASDK